MNKYNTILGQMLDLISRSRFEKLVKEHKTEHGAKGLRSWTLTGIFESFYSQEGESYANARTVRNFFEKSIKRQANRLANKKTFKY